MAVNINTDVVMKGVRSGTAFIADSGENSISGTSEHDYLILKNPSGSGRRLLITHYVLGVDSTLARTTWRVYASPTVTADGTSITVNNTYAKSSPESAVAEAYRDPTISARGALMTLKLSTGIIPVIPTRSIMPII